MNQKPTVTISDDIYRRILRSADKLECLEAGGVDNWPWYPYALEEYGYFDRDEEEDDEFSL